MSIQKKALGNALALLQSIGAQYAVIFDGETHGTLQVVLPKPPKPEPKRRPVQFRWLDVYQAWVNAARPGSTFIHECDTQEAADSLRASVGSVLSKRFGIGGSMSTITRKDGKFIVEALVISDNKAQFREPA